MYDVDLVFDSTDVRRYRQRPIRVNQQNDNEYFANLFFVLYYIFNQFRASTIRLFKHDLLDVFVTIFHLTIFGTLCLCNVPLTVFLLFMM